MLMSFYFDGKDHWSIKKTGKFVVNSRNKIAHTTILFTAISLVLSSSTALANPVGGVTTDGTASISL